MVGSEFLKYGDTLDHAKRFVLLDDSKDRIYLAQSGVVSGPVPGAFPTHKTPMAVSGARELKAAFMSGVKLSRPMSVASNWSRRTPSSAAHTLWASAMR